MRLIQELGKRLRSDVTDTVTYLDDGGGWDRQELLRVLIKHALWTVLSPTMPEDAGDAQAVFFESMEPDVEDLIDEAARVLAIEGGTYEPAATVWPDGGPVMADDPEGR